MVYKIVVVSLMESFDEEDFPKKRAKNGTKQHIFLAKTAYAPIMCLTVDDDSFILKWSS